MTDLATGSLNSVVFWETKSFLRRRSAQPFPKGCQIASLSWNPNSTPQSHFYRIDYCVTILFTPSDTKLAVVPKWGDRVAICDFHDDIMTWSFLLHKEGGSFTCGSLMHNSRFLACGCGNSSVLIWDLKNKNISRAFQGHTSAVSAVVRSANDHLVVSGSQSGTILMCTVSSSAAQQMVNLTKNQPLKQVVNRLSFSQMEKSHVGSVCDDGVVCLWSVESQRMLAKFSPSHTSAATDVCFSPSNNMLMTSVGLDAKIKCYDIHSRRTVTEITAPAPLSSVAILRDGSTLVGGGSDGKLYIYELRTVKTPREVIEAHQSPVTCINQQNSTKSTRRSSARGTSSSTSRTKEQPPSPIKDSSVLASTSSLTTMKDKLNTIISTSVSATVAPVLTSTEGSSLESHDRQSQPHLLGEEVPPFVGRATHIQTVTQPEMVTPFVTTQQRDQQGQGMGGGGGREGRGVKMEQLPEGLSVQTPLGVGLKQQSKLSEGLPYAMTTPANPLGHTSSIFSPLDAQLITPVHKVTAAIAPTLRTTPLDTAAHSAPTSVSSSQPGSVAHSQFAATGGGIFSPLDSGMQNQSIFGRPSTTATPTGVAAMAQGKLNTSLNLSAMGPPSLPPSSLLTSSRFAGQKTQERSMAQSTPVPSLGHQQAMAPGMKPSTREHEITDENHMKDFPVGEALHQTLSDSSQTHQMPGPSQLPPPEENVSPSKALPTGESEKHAVAADTQSPPPTASAHPLLLPASQLEGGAGAVPVPGIQMKFMENMIKDSQEELWYSVHRDIRALSVDIFRQFFALQQQSAAQFAALNEKVERLSEENKRLQELVYQYMPKH